MTRLHDLEQHIMVAWGTAEDIDLLHRMLLDRPEPMSENDISNALLGIWSLHQMRCEQLFQTYEQLIRQGAHREDTEASIAALTKSILGGQAPGDGRGDDEEDDQRGDKGKKKLRGAKEKGRKRA
jgi:hypothetical protein